MKKFAYFLFVSMSLFIGLIPSILKADECIVTDVTFVTPSNPQPNEHGHGWYNGTVHRFDLGGGFFSVNASPWIKCSSSQDPRDCVPCVTLVVYEDTDPGPGENWAAHSLAQIVDGTVQADCGATTQSNLLIHTQPLGPGRYKIVAGYGNWNSATGVCDPVKEHWLVFNI